MAILMQIFTALLMGMSHTAMANVSPSCEQTLSPKVKVDEWSEEQRALIKKVLVEDGLLLNESGEPIHFPGATSFVVNMQNEFLVSTDLDKVSHQHLGRGEEVLHSGVIITDQGRVLEMGVYHLSAYEASPENLFRFVQKLEAQGVNLGRTKFSLVYELRGRVRKHYEIDRHELELRAIQANRLF